MPYPQDLVGKYVRFNDFSDTGLIQSNYTIKEDVHRMVSASVYTAAPKPRGAQGYDFTQHNPPWNFTFLKYAPGAVSAAPLNGDVMTGPMSGCYLIVYTKGGRQMLAHVGTYGSATDAASVRAKDAWRALLTHNGVAAVQGADPFNEITMGEFTTMVQAQPANTVLGPTTFGYFTPGGAAYAVVLAKVSSTMLPPFEMNKVIFVKAMNLQPWAAISATPKFT